MTELSGGQSRALLSGQRVVMRGGAMCEVLTTADAEKRLARQITALDAAMARLRDRIRAGERLGEHDLESQLQPVMRQLEAG